MPKIVEFKKRDALAVALDELKYAESRLQASDERLDGIWNEFMVARRDRADAQADVKRFILKVSKIASKAMLSKLRTPESVSKIPQRLKFPGRDPLKKLKPLPGMSDIMHRNELREVRAAAVKKQTVKTLGLFDIEIPDEDDPLCPGDD